MLTSSVLAMLLEDNARPHTAAHTRALLEHFNWQLLDHPPYSPDLPTNDYYLFTYLENWLISEHFSNNRELMEGVKTWRQASLTQAYKNLFPNMTSASIPMVTILRSSLCRYFLYIITFLFLIASFGNSSLEVTF
jgi:hypothetical protein